MPDSARSNLLNRCLYIYKYRETGLPGLAGLPGQGGKEQRDAGCPTGRCWGGGRMAGSPCSGARQCTELGELLSSGRASTGFEEEPFSDFSLKLCSTISLESSNMDMRNARAPLSTWCQQHLVLYPALPGRSGQNPMEVSCPEAHSAFFISHSFSLYPGLTSDEVVSETY